jgi:Ca-activated chloride channel family protein
MRVPIVALALVLGLGLAHAETSSSSTWQKLWRTADQRGDALLQSGNAAGAAQEYADPQRKAYAQLQAGDHAGAAQSLKGVNATDAYYNRGNALAHLGDLQGALTAYDATLQAAPQHQDARRNRDLVAKALKQQQQKKNGSDPNPPKDSKQGDKQGDPNGENSDGKKGDKPGNAQDAADGKQDHKPQDGQDKGQAEANKDDAAQARRDAQASLGEAKPGQPPKPADGTPGGNADAKDPTAAMPSPLTEKQIAQEQWLRSIPDDPGGLLRRKFLIEHMLRQQGKKP